MRITIFPLFTLIMVGCGGGGDDAQAAPVRNSSNTADYGVSLPRIRIDRALGGYIDGPPYSPLNLKVGDTLRLYPEVFNNNAYQGGSVANVRITFDGGNPITQPMSEGGIATNSSQSGATTPAFHSGGNSVTTSASYQGSSANVGQHTIVIEIDYTGTITETNETNNTYTLVFNVTTTG